MPSTHTLWIFWGLPGWKLRLRPLRFFYVQLLLPRSNTPPPLRYKYVKCLRLPEYTALSRMDPPPFEQNLYVRPSQILPLPLRIYSPFQQIYATLPKSTSPSQNLPPFQQPYATLPESTLPPRIYPFSTTVCDTHRIYPSFPEYPSFKKNRVCDSPRIYPFLPGSTLHCIYVKCTSSAPRIYCSVQNGPPF